MFSFIANLFGYIMNFTYSLVQNYGLAIILFTFLVKLLLLPLTIKQQKSMDKVQELQPLYQELQRKYGNDQQRFTMEYQKLLKEKNLNMFSGSGCSGCLLQLIQIPIILGLFYMMMSPLTYILKLPAEQINEYKEELNTYYAEEALKVATISGEELSEEEKEAILNKDYVSKNRYNELVIAKHNNLFNMNFLGINLGDIANENKNDYVLYIMPFLCMMVTYISLSMASKQTQNMKQNANETSLTNPENEIPMPDMKVMNMMMPFMTGYIAFIAPQGLALYWTTNTILQLVQTATLKKLMKKFEKKDNIIK